MGLTREQAEHIWIRRILARYARNEGERLLIEAGARVLVDDAMAVRHVWRRPRAEMPRCGARTRGGTPCKARALDGRTRCRMHGGLSTGPRTEAGREAIAASNRRRALMRRLAAMGVVDAPQDAG